MSSIPEVVLVPHTVFHKIPNQAAEARYRRLFETAKDGIVILAGESGEITDINTFMIELFGFSGEELRGRLFWEAEPLAGIPEARTTLDRLRAEEAVRFPDVSLRARDGRNVDVEIVGNIYLEGEERVIQFNIRDITERKNFNRQLQQSAKLESLGLMAGGIAHDFNNLLTGIMGNASLMLDRAAPDSRDCEFLREIVKSSQRASDLTRQMLAYSGQGRYVLRLTDFSALVRETSCEVRRSIPKLVNLELHLNEHLPPIGADAIQLQQLVTNLVANAAEAIPEGSRGTVRVLTSQEELNEEHIRLNFAREDIAPGTYICLQITDTGTGMDEATKANIFDPFFTTKFIGRGLGLAAALGIVKGHRGAIRVASTPGQGTTFRVYFPALAVEQPSMVSSNGIPRIEDPSIFRLSMEDALLHLPCSTIHEYRRSQVIYDQNQPSTCIYLVIDGNVKVCRIAENGSEVVMDVYQSDEFFGEAAFLGSSVPRTEFAVAAKSTRIMAWTIEQIEDIVAYHPRLAIALLHLFVQRSMDFGERIASLAMDNIALRLARALLRFSERMGLETGDGSMHMIPLTHELLAQYVGTSRGIITRYMNQFRREGYVRYSREGIMLRKQMVRDWLSLQTTGRVPLMIMPSVPHRTDPRGRDHARSIDHISLPSEGSPGARGLGSTLCSNTVRFGPQSAP